MRSVLLWVNCAWFWGHHWLFSSEILVRALIRVVGRWHMYNTKYSLTVKCWHLNHKLTLRRKINRNRNHKLTQRRKINRNSYILLLDETKQSKRRAALLLTRKSHLVPSISQVLVLGFFEHVVVKWWGLLHVFVLVGQGAAGLTEGVLCCVCVSGAVPGSIRICPHFSLFPVWHCSCLMHARVIEGRSRSILRTELWFLF